MASFTLFALQAAGAIAQQPDERLLHPVPRVACHASGGEIVVCARAADTYRLPTPEPPPGMHGLGKAETGFIGDTKIGVGATERSVGGFSAPAVMVTVTIPF